MLRSVLFMGLNVYSLHNYCTYEDNAMLIEGSLLLFMSLKRLHTIGNVVLLLQSVLYTRDWFVYWCYT